MPVAKTGVASPVALLGIGCSRERAAELAFLSLAALLLRNLDIAWLAVATALRYITPLIRACPVLIGLVGAEVAQWLGVQHSRQCRELIIVLVYGPYQEPAEAELLCQVLFLFKRLLVVVRYPLVIQQSARLVCSIATALGP